MPQLVPFFREKHNLSRYFGRFTQNEKGFFSVKTSVPSMFLWLKEYSFPTCSLQLETCSL